MATWGAKKQKSWDAVPQSNRNAHHAVIMYLNDGNGPFFGASEMRDSSAFDRSKKTGARWDAKSRRYYADDEESLRKMLLTKKWRPPVDADILLKLLNQRKEFFATQRAAAERAEAASAEPEVASEATAQARDNSAELHIRSVLHVPDNTPMELERVFALCGVDAAGVDATAKWTILGPRSGISNAFRLLRGLKLNVVTPEQVRAHVADVLTAR